MKRTGFPAGLALASVMWAMSAVTTSAQSTAPKARVELRLLSTQRSGATGPAASTGGELAVGEKWVAGVYGDFDGSHGAGGWLVGGTAGYAWRLEARLVSVGINSVQVAITWGRYHRGSGAETPEVGDSRVVNLMTAQRHVLDSVQSEDPESDEANFVVEIGANLVEDPAYANAAIDYDVWFVHDDDAGQKTARRLHIVGSQGEWRAFSFRPFGFGLDGSLLAVGAPAPVVANADGEIIGRLRADGTIGLAIRNRFGIDCSVEGMPGGSGANVSRGRGEKELIARDGETISLEMPTGIGWCTISPPPDDRVPARAGVKTMKGGVRITGADFFRGDRFSLLVTVRRGK